MRITFCNHTSENTHPQMLPTHTGKQEHGRKQQLYSVFIHKSKKLIFSLYFTLYFTSLQGETLAEWRDAKLTTIIELWSLIYAKN